MGKPVLAGIIFAPNDMYEMPMVPNIILKHYVITKHVSFIRGTGLVMK